MLSFILRMFYQSGKVSCILIQSYMYNLFIYRCENTTFLIASPFLKLKKSFFNKKSYFIYN